MQAAGSKNIKALSFVATKKEGCKGKKGEDVGKKIRLFEKKDVWACLCPVRGIARPTIEKDRTTRMGPTESFGRSAGWKHFSKFIDMAHSVNDVA